MGDEYLSVTKSPENVKIHETSKDCLRFEQSANVLFKFMNKVEYLESLIKEKAIIPRYYEETIDYLEIGIEKIAFPMSCFCDIHLKKLVPHMEFYGAFGIGLKKQWGIDNGVQPIQYVNGKSNLIEDYKYVFKKSLLLSSEDTLIEEYSNYLLTNLLFMKPLEGKMLRDEEYEIRNFHDEREWRYVPNVSKANTELPLVIHKSNMNLKAYEACSKGVYHCNELWLKFEYDDIKYIIVENDVGRKRMINHIRECDGISELDAFELISKILVFNELKEDW